MGRTGPETRIHPCFSVRVIYLHSGTLCIILHFKRRGKVIKTLGGFLPPSLEAKLSRAFENPGERILSNTSVCVRVSACARGLISVKWLPCELTNDTFMNAGWDQ